MNPLRVRATNYRSFPELDLDLPQGCVAVIGENGAGKSSVINLIDIALFGAEGRSLADYLTDDGIAEVCVVELTFEHAGHLYRARRGFSARGRGKTTVDFEKRWAENISGGEHAWEPLTCESTKETDALIERTIGLTRQTFRASAFLNQGNGAAFTEANPRDRKAVLAEVLGLDVWARLLERAKQDRRAAEAQLERIAGETDAALVAVSAKGEVEVDLATSRTRVVELVALVEAEERNVAELQERYRAAADQAAKRATLEAELATAGAELDRLHHADVAATEAATQIGVCRDELETLTTDSQQDDLVKRERELLAAVEEQRRLREAQRLGATEARAAKARRATIIAQADTAEVRAASLRAEIGRMEDGHAETCPTCKQALDVQARLEAIESLTKDAVAAIDEANARRQEADAITVPEIGPPADDLAEAKALAELAGVRDRLERVQAQVQQRARLEERIAQLERTVAARPDEAAIAEVVRACTALRIQIGDIEPVDLDAITAAGQAARGSLDRSRASHHEHATTVARLEERLDQILKAEQLLAANAERTRELHAEIDLCALLEKAYGRDGVPALVIENSAIPYIETEAARILALLGGSTATCTVELRTQAALKSGDGLRDTLDVVIVGDQGERAYETFSGGERTRINLALRIALARLLAHRRGAESRLLAIDEPEFLDDTGTAALVEVLRGLQDDFDRVYLISHVPALRDSFDEVISVTKDDDGRSRIEHALVTAEALA